MGGTESETTAIMSNLATLLRTGKFSDLTLLCQEQDFLVHKAIVCARSPVYAAAVQGGFKEAQTKVVDVDIVDAATLRRALTYLYTGAYDDGELSAVDYLVPVTTSQRPGIEVVSRPKEINESKGFAWSPQSEEFLDKQNPESPTAPDIVATEPRRSCCTCRSRKEDPDLICNNERLRNNALVYIFADYYQIPELTCLSTEKFIDTLGEICQNGLGEVCDLVYGFPACELRACLSDAIARNEQQVIDNADLMDTLLGLPEPLRDAFVNIVGHERCFIGRKRCCNGSQMPS